MSGILVVAESRQGALREITFEAICAAHEVAAASALEVSVATIGADAEDRARELIRTGVHEVLAVPTTCTHFEPSVWQRSLESLVESERPSVVILGHTIDSLGFAAAVAARLSLGLATDVVSVAWDGEVVAEREPFGGKVVTAHRFPGKECVVLSLRAGAYPAVAEASEQSSVRLYRPPSETAAKSVHLEYVEPETGDVDITKADFLLSIGRGVEDKGDLPRFEALADRLGATLSVSRPLVDAGWVPRERQVGQSGKTVTPRVYLALGISGATQHLAGIGGAQTVIAVNTDPEAPIFNASTYGAVADLFDVVEELERSFG